MKRKPERKDVKIREVPPKVRQTKKGIVVECPFCNPAHPILPGVPSPCGTVLKVTAVQQYITSHGTRYNKITCLKCGKFGGEMVQYRNGFVHIEDCTPGTKLMPEIPKLSLMAKFVYHLPEKVRSFIEKSTGSAKELQEIDGEGKHTGKVVGYFFWKVKNAQTPSTNSS